MIGLSKFFEQSEMNEEKYKYIFKATRALDKGINQIIAKNVYQKKITDFFILNIYK